MPEELTNPQFFNPEKDITIGHNRLPHWDQAGSCYFITFRLFDSVPAPLLKELREAERLWLAAHPQPWSEELEREYLNLFQGQIDRWLDQGYGVCVLRDRSHAQIVARTLAFFEHQRTRLHAWVVMPNHVHVLAEIFKEFSLSEVLKSWKSYTATEINGQLGRTGPLWQKGYHDRLIRNWEHFGNVVRYIRRNPSKAQLPDSDYLQGESELAAMF
jgi:putative transposase